MRTTRAGLVAAAACLAWSATASASGFDIEGWYLLAGAPLGASWAEGDPLKFTAGAELSVAKLSGDALWYGAYADVVLNAGHTRFSMGPELGWAFLGLDGGVLLRDDGEPGFTLRPMLTLALLSAYYRYGSYFDDSLSFHETGVLIKLPLSISDRD